MTLLMTFPTLLVPVLAVCGMISFAGFFTTKSAYAKNSFFQKYHFLIGVIFLLITVGLFLWKVKY